MPAFAAERAGENSDGTCGDLGRVYLAATSSCDDQLLGPVTRTGEAPGGVARLVTSRSCRSSAGSGSCCQALVSVEPTAQALLAETAATPWRAASVPGLGTGRALPCGAVPGPTVRVFTEKLERAGGVISPDCPALLAERGSHAGENTAACRARAAHLLPGGAAPPQDEGLGEPPQSAAAAACRPGAAGGGGGHPGEAGAIARRARAGHPLPRRTVPGAGSASCCRHWCGGK